MYTALRDARDGGGFFGLAALTGAAACGYQVGYSNIEGFKTAGAMTTMKSLMGKNNAQLFLLCLFYRFRLSQPSFLALGPIAAPALVQMVASLKKVPAVAPKVAWLDAKITGNLVQVWAMAIQLEIGSLIMLLVRFDVMNAVILTRLLKARYHCSDSVVMRVKMTHSAAFFHVQIWGQLGGYIDRVAVYVPPLRSAISAVARWFKA